MKNLLCLAVAAVSVFLSGCGKNGGFHKNLAVVQVDEWGEFGDVSAESFAGKKARLVGCSECYFNDVARALKSEGAAQFLAERLPPGAGDLISKKYGNGKSLADVLHDSVIVIPDECRRTIAVGFAFADKGLSVELANVFAAEFVADDHDRRIKGMMDSIESLNEKSEETAARVKELDERILEFRIANEEILSAYDNAGNKDAKAASDLHRISDVVRKYKALKRERGVAESLHQSFVKTMEIRAAQMKLIGPTVIIVRGASL